MQQDRLDKLAEAFARFGAVECRGRSSLYERLSALIAADPELLAIAAHGRSPVPNLFLGAVHYLLRRDPGAGLRRFYPDLTPNPVDSRGLPEAFRAYCLGHRRAIEEILRNRFVQTNEVARCGYLLPAFTLVWEMGGRKPLALVEVGTAAGLHLAFDRYAYDYGGGRLYGDVISPLKLEIELRGSVKPPLDDVPPPAARRIGIDLNPIRPGDRDAIEWLEALIWPEHDQRRRNLQAALEIVNDVAIEFIRGDASELIESVLTMLPPGTPACVFQSAALNQFPVEARARFFAALDRFGSRRELFFISREDDLTMTHYRNGTSSRLLAGCDAHGKWVKWVHVQS